MFTITSPHQVHNQNDQGHVRCDFLRGHSTMRFVAVATLFLYISLINNPFLVLFVLVCCFFSVSFDLFWYFVKFFLGKAAACAAINAWFNANQGINLLDCNIECCSGDNCNNHNLTLYPLNTTTAPMDSNTTGAGTTIIPTTVAHGNNKQKLHAIWGN